MVDRDFGAGFTRTDAQRSTALLTYLDAVAAVPAVAQSKAAATAALGLAAGDTVLELGCGTGVDLPALADAVGSGGGVVGLDPSRMALDAAARRVGDRPWVELVEGVAEALPLPDAAVDACRADRTLQHAADPERALAEIARVLRPGGRLVVLELEVRLDGVAPAAMAPFTGGLFDQGDRAWLPLMLPLLLARAGFVDVRTDERQVVSTSVTDVRAMLRVDAAVADGTVGAEAAAAAEAALGAAASAATLRLQLSPTRTDARLGQPAPSASRGAP